MTSSPRPRLSTAERTDGGALDESRERHFARMMDLVATAHPFYADRMRELGLSRADFDSLGDLRRLPITRKPEYLANPESFRLRVERCGDLGLAERTMREVVYTTGSTSGRPTPFYDTSWDHVARLDQLRQTASWAGIGARDTVANLFPLTTVPHQGFLSALYGPLTVGARVIRGFTGRRDTPFPVYQDTEELARLIARQQATVLWGITSFLRKVVLVAQELGLDYSHVRLAFAAGEACPPGVREDIRIRLGELGARQVTIQNGYGFTEMQGPTVECREGGNLHVPSADQYHFEVVDPHTGEPKPDGEVGLVLVSHLNRRGTVLLRYAVGDLSAVERDTCPDCGRHGLRFVAKPRRADDLIKVKGTLVNPASLTDALAAIGSVEDFQFVVSHAAAGDPASGDELVVRYLPADGSETAAIEREIAAAVADACEITPRPEQAARSEFESLTADYKFKRLVDERDSDERHPDPSSER